LDRRAQIEATLRRDLAADPVLVVDESHLHAGHAGARGGAGHFRAVVVSARFEGRSALERQRLVYAALADEMGREIHALSMQTLTPAQWREQSRGSRPPDPGPGGGSSDRD
jgi:BolA protein